MANLVNEGGSGLFAASLVQNNDAIVADVNAAVAAQAGLRLMGYSAKESAGTPAAATFAIKHGATVAGGTDVVYQNFAASGSTLQWFGDSGIACPNGISLDWLTGQVDVAIFYKIVN
ncbi:MAG: hypothetical protein ACXWAT_10150 [Methylobacter sp.]